ncbi:hypothetical protein CEXT_614851 [Caerostris extrusa]|uniref:Uncharacterized protein n=1 Tax=Caerostris extrusa TaxID=172846 RepID=A0AAV4WDD5_CAEEX|nr:hypothetical protein CEXT_614851 [Caerostris extrusa]
MCFSTCGGRMTEVDQPFLVTETEAGEQDRGSGGFRLDKVHPEGGAEGGQRRALPEGLLLRLLTMLTVDKITISIILHHAPLCYSIFVPLYRSTHGCPVLWF